mmetsp:Transcript_21411/g.42958  ORF Transcript_21411/g.42958 Transcript_21411/m.42958 type:complete len:216 (-) Transcript_21411:3689-4336(-)
MLQHVNGGIVQLVCLESLPPVEDIPYCAILPYSANGFPQLLVHIDVWEGCLCYHFGCLIRFLHDAEALEKLVHQARNFLFSEFRTLLIHGLNLLLSLQCKFQLIFIRSRFEKVRAIALCQPVQLIQASNVAHHLVFLFLFLLIAHAKLENLVHSAQLINVEVREALILALVGFSCVVHQVLDGTNDIRVYQLAEMAPLSFGESTTVQDCQLLENR